MKHYTDTIPLDLSKKLKEAGMPEIIAPTYADCLDWLASREIFVNVEPIRRLEDNTYHYEALVTYDCANNTLYIGRGTWHEAANKAIEKALEVI